MSHWFLERLSLFGASDAIVRGGEICGYDHLLRLVDDWQDFLDREEVKPGQVVALEGECSPTMCAGLLALIARGAVVVPLTRTPAAKRAEFFDIAEVEVAIEVEGPIEVEEQGGPRCQHTGRRAEHALYRRLRRDARPGLVLFTSGTSGRSKASLLDFEKVLRRYGEPKRQRRTLSFLQLDHIGGINTLLHTFSQGGAIITVPERSVDAVFGTIAQQRVDVLPTTPTFLNMVLISAAYERYDTRNLSLITYGAEPMPLQTLRRLRTALPHVRFKQTYGLSELGILPTQSRSDDTLWLKLGTAGFDYKVLDGILWIRSEMAMLGYLNAPAPFDGEGFFNTEDEVETDGDYLRIRDRRSQIINVAGEKVYPSEVESVLLEVPNVAEATVTGRPSHVTGMVVKATIQTVESEDVTSLTRRVREHCRKRLEPFKVPAVVEVSDARQHSERFKKIRSAT